MNKVALFSVVAVALVIVGTITFSPFVHADLTTCSGSSNGTPWEEVWIALCELQDQIETIQIQVDTMQLGGSGTGAGVFCPNLPDGADMQRADLGLANLPACDLSNANFDHASFRYANLQNANLGNTILEGADLTGANLRGANLSGADLTRADLTRADLTGANLNGAILIDTNLNCLNNSICNAL